MLEPLHSNSVGGGGAVIKLTSIKIHSCAEHCRWGTGCNKTRES
jgi:hypothetical protein